MLIVPGFNKAGALAFGAGALTTYASSILCPYTEGGKGSGGNFCDVNMNDVCTTFDQGQGLLYQIYDGIEITKGANYAELVAIGCDKYGPTDEPDSKGYFATYRDIKSRPVLDGPIETVEVILYYKGGNPALQSKPLFPNDPNVPDGQCTAKPRLEPWEGKDGQDCDITVQGLGMGATPGGNVAPIMLIEPGHQKQKWEDEKQWENESPGVINPNQAPSFQNECSFAPVLVYPTPGGEPVVVPIEPGEDIQEALDRLGSEMNDQFDDVDSALDGINDKLDEIIDDIPDSPGEPIDIPGGTVTFRAVCDKDDQGNLEEVEYQLGGATTTNQALVEIYSNQTKLFAMLQQHLNWKTPVCMPTKPELEGDRRTIHFRSNETSPNGKSRLRKRLRYWSSSGLGLGEVVEHWRLFQWNAGSVFVGHSGSSCGTLAVWAADEREGQRVIRHAFAEAGVDPDQAGRWSTGGSDNARYGVPGEMKVDTRKGFYWITSRDGPDGRPLVAET